MINNPTPQKQVRFLPRSIQIGQDMFHTFVQNNSGGSFDFEEWKISHYVIVEGDDLEDIIDRAVDIGIYFGGDGDCECCGDRWYEPWAMDGLDDRPMIYGEPVESFRTNWQWMAPRPEGYIHYKDGTVKEIRPEKE